MNNRKLVAVLACRADSTRLYAKPLQNLTAGKTILDQILDTFDNFPEVISESVIAISEGVENLAYIEFAKHRGVRYLIGSKWDIMSRLINGALISRATDILRVTSECPFIHWERIEEAWQSHLDNDNDVTAIDGCPLGTYFEIIKLKTLIKSHAIANDYQKEACTQIFRDYPDKYKVEIKTPLEFRLDIRLTVDYPEDLVVCRRIYENFKDRAPLIKLKDIILFWDNNPEFKKLLKPYISNKGIWVNNEGCIWSGKQC
jgi:spore coat polysaccharide biosynthesis protein SpsF